MFLKLSLDIGKFNSQYQQINVKDLKSAHDRFLIIDSSIYHFGASLKDLGKKWFAFSLLQNDTLTLLQKLKEIK